MIKIMAFWGLYWGAPILGKLPTKALNHRLRNLCQAEQELPPQLKPKVQELLGRGLSLLFVCN